MKQPKLDTRHRDKGGALGFAKTGSDQQARLIDVLHELDDEISQLIRDTPLTPISTFDHGISRLTERLSRSA